MFMKKKNTDNQCLTIAETDLLLYMQKNGMQNQRILSEETGYSLGMINKLLHGIQDKGYLDQEYRLTATALQQLEQDKPRNAVILAAGFGMRMVPINLSAPKAFLEVKGERLIERLITQLHEAGIQKITVVAGFMKEEFEYLIDEFGVDLVINEAYASKNNLYSLAEAAGELGNTYIVPCDLWCRNNPFSKYELYSWYAVSEEKTADSDLRLNRKRELVRTEENDEGNRMIGICYLTEEDAVTVKENLRRLISDRRYEQSFWETALYGKDKLNIHARIFPDEDIIEINTYEQLRDLDADSTQLHSDAIHTISSVFHVHPSEITNISVLKKGMTNRSFLFTVDHRKYIMRIPGEGTERLISRKNEAQVYEAISGKGLCDDPVYINPDNGYKITAYLENVRVCDSDDILDLQKCMKKLRQFHEMKLEVQHTFDLFGQIEFYESLWNGKPSVYRDYVRTKENVLELKEYIQAQPKDWCLTHIDAVCDNFLFYTKDGKEELQLTDWEYAGMQDPHVDIAMFCIYSMYDKTQTDRLIDLYFEYQCPDEVRTKIYCYIAACGLLWSNWCEFKRQLGVEFGEYSLRQYRFAKEYYHYAKERMTQEKEGVNHD